MQKFCVDVCIATYKRPYELSILLDSLANQQLPDIEMRVIVIDNDKNGCAEKIVEQKKNETFLNILYLIEPSRGISSARNCALDKATAPYIAFLDDDEYVNPDWLKTMFHALEKFDADIVSGPVIKLLPATSPQWVKVHPAFAQMNITTGKSLDHCGFGNVLFSAKSLGNPPQKVDLKYTLTGGEDTDFFYRLKKSGRSLIWCDEAIAFEHVPEERMKLRWILKRYYRFGQVSYRVFFADANIAFKAFFVIQQIILVLLAVIVLPGYLIFSFSNFVLLLSRICNALGKLSAIFGDLLIYSEYQDKNYR